MGPEGRDGEAANGRPLGTPRGVAGTGLSVVAVGHLSTKPICACVDRDTPVSCMYPKSRECSVNTGWEEEKRRRDEKKVGWIAGLGMDGLQGWDARADRPQKRKVCL